jgi:hypothetical protein
MEWDPERWRNTPVLLSNLKSQISKDNPYLSGSVQTQYAINDSYHLLPGKGAVVSCHDIKCPQYCRPVIMRGLCFMRLSQTCNRSFLLFGALELNECNINPQLYRDTTASRSWWGFSVLGYLFTLWSGLDGAIVNPLSNRRARNLRSLVKSDW